IDGNRERALRGLLADHVLLQDRVDLLRLREVLEVEGRGPGQLLVDDLVAEIDALVADVDARPSDQLLDLPLRLPAEAAEELLIGVCRSGHAVRAPSVESRVSQKYSLDLRVPSRNAGRSEVSAWK